MSDMPMPRASVDRASIRRQISHCIAMNVRPTTALPTGASMTAAAYDILAIPELGRALRIAATIDECRILPGVCVEARDVCVVTADALLDLIYFISKAETP